MALRCGQCGWQQKALTLSCLSWASPRIRASGASGACAVPVSTCIVLLCLLPSAGCPCHVQRSELRPSFKCSYSWWNSASACTVPFPQVLTLDLGCSGCATMHPTGGRDRKKVQVAHVPRSQARSALSTQYTAVPKDYMSECKSLGDIWMRGDSSVALHSVPHCRSCVVMLAGFCCSDAGFFSGLPAWMLLHARRDGCSIMAVLAMLPLPCAAKTKSIQSCHRGMLKCRLFSFKQLHPSCSSVGW